MFLHNDWRRRHGRHLRWRAWGLHRVDHIGRYILLGKIDHVLRRKGGSESRSVDIVDDQSGIDPCPTHGDHLADCGRSGCHLPSELGGDLRPVLGGDLVELGAEDVAGDGPEPGSNRRSREWVTRLAADNGPDTGPGQPAGCGAPVGVVGGLAAQGE